MRTSILVRELYRTVRNIVYTMTCKENSTHKFAFSVNVSEAQVIFTVLSRPTVKYICRFQCFYLSPGSHYLKKIRGTDFVESFFFLESEPAKE